MHTESFEWKYIGPSTLATQKRHCKIKEMLYPSSTDFTGEGKLNIDL
jgi:hypothetical protein